LAVVYQRSSISPWPSLAGVLTEVVVTPEEGGVMLAI
jgi:hypothetical protein